MRLGLINLEDVEAATQASLLHFELAELPPQRGDVVESLLDRHGVCEGPVGLKIFGENRDSLLEVLRRVEEASLELLLEGGGERERGGDC